MKKLSRHDLLTILASLLTWSIFGAWCYWDSSRIKERSFQELCRLSCAFSGALQGSAQCEIRNGYIRTDRIATIYENIVATTDLAFIRLYQDGKILLQVGDGFKEDLSQSSKNWPEHQILDQKSPLDFQILMQDFFITSKAIKLDNCRGRCLGATIGSNGKNEQAVSISGKTQQLIVGLRSNHFFSYREELNLRLWIIFIVGTLAIGGFTLFNLRNYHTRLLQNTMREMQLRTEQLEEVGLAAKGLAHETKNPLGLIRGLTQRALQNATHQELRSQLEAILDQSDVAVSRLNHFMAYAGNRKTELKEISLQEILQNLQIIFEPDFTQKKVTLVLPTNAPKIVADQEFLTQILINLLLNSLRASQENSQVVVQIHLEGSNLTLTVTDQGIGIAPELLPEIFKPYVTGQNGHGLGLAIVRRLVDQLQWQISVQSELKGGTTFTISKISLASGSL